MYSFKEHLLSAMYGYNDVLTDCQKGQPRPLHLLVKL